MALTLTPLEPIRSFRGPFRWLSNFWPSPVILGGVEYPTVEHAYQAAKTIVPEERARIRNALAPRDAKRLGRTVTLRPHWAQRRCAIMLILLRQKFGRPPLRAELLATFPRPLIEGNIWGDIFWGVWAGSARTTLGGCSCKCAMSSPPRTRSNPEALLMTKYQQLFDEAQHLGHFPFFFSNSLHAPGGRSAHNTAGRIHFLAIPCVGPDATDRMVACITHKEPNIVTHHVEGQCPFREYLPDHANDT